MRKQLTCKQAANKEKDDNDKEEKKKKDDNDKEEKKGRVSKQPSRKLLCRFC